MDTNFLFGGGLAFLIALLGWGDQIRGTQEKVLNQERQFIKTLKLRWKDVRASIRDDSTPAQKLASILRLLDRRKLQDVEDIDLIKKFNSLDTIRSSLEDDYKTRFQLVLITSIVMLGSGVLSTFLSGVINNATSMLTWEFLYTYASLTFISLIILETIIISIKEEKLHEILEVIEDSLRLVEDFNHN